MSIAITEDHQALVETAADLLAKRDARGAARALLEAPEEPRPALWDDIAKVGWLGLHVAEEHGGSGAGAEELVVVVVELGRALAPGAFVPTVIASAVLEDAGDDATRKELLPGLADGTQTAGVGLGGTVEVRDGKASGVAGAVLGGGLADLIMVGAGDDVVIVDVAAGDTLVEVPPNLHPTRRTARVTLDGAAATVLPGARQALTDLSRLFLSAEAVGSARECSVAAAEYAKVREQFGRSSTPRTHMAA
jgi:alkylation response protein AidB-like acyl-CoA dehydrogenase